MKRIDYRAFPSAVLATLGLLLASIAGCSSDGNGNSGGNGAILELPPPSAPPPGDGDGSGITNTPLPFSETFGNGRFVNFDQGDTIAFFSADYQALATDDADDPRRGMFYPTCCFFNGDDPDGEISVDHVNRLGLVSDNGNPSLLVSNARFSVAQTRSPLANAGASDPKKDSTPGTDPGQGWGELDLSRPYRISFCVKARSGSSSSITQLYVDNNTTSEASSIHGGGSGGSRIFNVPTLNLVPARRVTIDVPGDVTLEPGGAAVDNRPRLVGTSQSFLQFRVSSGASLIIDDLLIEYQDQAGNTPVAECTSFTPATPPPAMAAPNLTATDGAIAASWSATLGAASYDIAYNTAESPETANAAVVISGITATQTTITGLTNGTVYFLFVRGVNSTGVGPWSPAATATPTAPAGCTPTQQVQPSRQRSILWNVYDGCLAPGDPGSVVVSGSTPSNFTFAGTEASSWTANDDGTTTLDTTASGTLTSRGDLAGVIGGLTGDFPKRFTLLARVDTPTAAARGMEMQVSFGDPGQRRVKVILRPDQPPAGRLQLERFLDGTDTPQADVTMNDGFHIYQINLVMNGPYVDNVTPVIDARVFRDGVEISDQFTTTIANGGTGRDGGAAAPTLRIGEDASSSYQAVVDWILWSDDQSASIDAATLVGELPDGIGELGFYAPAVCTPAQQVMPSPMRGIVWNVYDACLAPGDTGSVIVNGNTASNFTFASTEQAAMFTANGNGTTTLDSSANASLSNLGSLAGVIGGAAGTFPKHFSVLARVDTPTAGTGSAMRGIAIELSLGDPGQRRVKVLLRPDQGSGGIQLERFLDGGGASDDTAQAAVAMNDGFHIYQVNLVMSQAFVDGATPVMDVQVFRDGVDISSSFTPSIVAGGTGRDGGLAAATLRIGDDSTSNAYRSVLDWIVWSDNPSVTSLAPADLVGELPQDIGELGFYGAP